jgi:hypothetical protein
VASPRAPIAAFFIVLIVALVAVDSAQAAEWEISEEPLESLKITKETTSSSGGTFELLVSKPKLTIKCTSESGVGTIAAGGSASATMTLSGCVVVGAEKGCPVSSPGTETGHLSASTTSKFLEREIGETAKFYDSLSVTMTVVSSESCAFFEKSTVSGIAVAAVPKLGEGAVKRKLKFSQAIAEESGVASLTFGKSTAFFAGELEMQISGAYAGSPIRVGALQADPWPLEFTGGVNSTKQVKLKNLSGVWFLKLDEIGLTGPYGLTDPNGCIGKTLFLFPDTPPFECEVTLKCNEAKPGKFFAKWEALGSSSSGSTKVTMTC